MSPARASSERYYRYQDLSVSEIDPDGKNFPMFLNSLSRRQQNDLSNWIDGLFGYGLVVNPTPGHISIEIVSEKSKTNIVDTGYEIHRILLVLGQIWWASNRPPGPPQRRSDIALLTIEQPELHLHPAHQALLADAFVGGRAYGRSTSGSRKLPEVHYVIETHSETLVNRLGELIANGSIPAEDVQILIFDLDEALARTTNVKVATFSKEGALINWPYGFFQADR